MPGRGLVGRVRPPGVTTLATLALLGMAASWGSTFFLIKDLLHQISVLDFLAIRFGIAAVVVMSVTYRRARALTRAELGRAVLLGAIYGTAQVLQTLGLSTTPAGVSGFVTGMYVVATPLIGALVLSQRLQAHVWVAVGLATTGLGFLALNGFDVSRGVLLILASAVLYAIHILCLGRWSTHRNAVGLSAVQLVVIAAVCLVVAAPNGIGTPSTAGGWSSLVYMALIPGALALLAQTWAQAHVPPTRAAVVMTMEPVWAAFFAVLFGGEALTVRMVAGGALVVAAMYLVELGPRLRRGDRWRTGGSGHDVELPIGSVLGAQGPGEPPPVADPALERRKAALSRPARRRPERAPRRRARWPLPTRRGASPA